MVAKAVGRRKAAIDLDRLLRRQQITVHMDADALRDRGDDVWKSFASRPPVPLRSSVPDLVVVIREASSSGVPRRRSAVAEQHHAVRVSQRLRVVGG
jgi:hypothetical protein